MTTPRSHHEDSDFRQLTGAFDRPIAPSPRFAEELKARLAKETVAQKANIVPARPVSQRTARAGSAPLVTRRKWLDVAIAAALIVALLGGSFWYAANRIGDDAPSQPQVTRFAAEPLDSTPTSPRDGVSMLPGDPGNTNAYPETIDFSRTYTAESFGDVDMGAQEMLVVGDDLVFVGGALTDPTNLSIANPTLMSRDIASGDHNWSYQKPGTHLWPQQLATDGEHVYAVSFNPIVPTDTDTQVMGVPVTYHLVALDSETGEVLWETEQLHEIAGVEPSERYSTGAPVAVDNVVLVPYGPEILIALDSQSGEPVWILAPEEGESLYPDDAYLGGAPVVANGTTAFRGLPDGSVEEVDIETGMVRSMIPGPQDQEIITHMTLHLQGDYLAIVRDVAPDGDNIRSTIDVHNVATGVSGWSMGTSSSLGNIVVSPDTLIANEFTYREPSWIEQVLPFIDSPMPQTHVLAFDLATGDGVEMFDLAEFDFPPTVSAAGNAICIATETVRCVDRDGNEMVVEGYEVESYIPQNPPVYWNGQIIIGNGMGPLTIAKPGP